MTDFDCNLSRTLTKADYLWWSFIFYDGLCPQIEIQRFWEAIQHTFSAGFAAHRCATTFDGAAQRRFVFISGRTSFSS
ncbi:hypothetical protein NF681_14025 [Comamonadaceae bacterium OTU4NAUVB1]|nr:hypothetical protein NF681_14025 [Comamonadaceae bacterium OTU4NAUVB1]